jgi:putative membrane-bound dehydrogenase-like protein
MEIAAAMSYRSLILFLGVSAALAPAASAQLPPQKALSTFTVSDGLELSLWAWEPLLVNPTCIDIDHKGRIWVCESVNYRHTLRGRRAVRPEGDRILILEDTKGSGKADKVTTFYQAREMLAPMGIAVAKDPIGPGYKVYVCQSPDILVFEDKDGDGKADGPPRKLLTGFRGVDHDHGVHGILIGADSKLYFSVGDQGVQNLQSSDSKGRKWTTNRTDCQGGTIWRCDLDGTNLELLAHNFRNEYEPCVDSFGTIFVSDNDDDGNQQTRICYVMPGGNYGYWPRGPGQSHWHEEQPGVVPKILRTYFGSPTGICIYEGTLLPKKYWGQVLHTDAGPRHARCYHLTPQGAGYAVQREDMVASTDNWFRPSDICVAPDGSVFIADWYDPGVGGHGMGDTTRGRIFRLTPKGHKQYHVPLVDLESPAGLLAALGSPALSVRYMAMAKLHGMKAKEVFQVLRPVVRPQENSALRARALWQIGRLLLRDRTKEGDYPSRESLEQPLAIALADPDPRLRSMIIRMCSEPGMLSTAEGKVRYFKGLVDDPSSAVRRDVLLSLRDLDAAAAKPLILELAKRYDGKDRFYLEAIGIAVSHNDQVRREIILADFDEQFPDWNEKVANLIWELRPPQVLPRLEKRLVDAAMPSKQRSQIVDIVAAPQDANGGRLLLKVLLTEPPQDVRDSIIVHLKQCLPGKWRELRQSEELSQTVNRLLESRTSRASALALIEAAGRTDYVSKVTKLAGDASELPATRTAALQTLGSLPADEAVVALESLLKAEPPGLRALVVEALGQQAQPRNRRMGFGPPGEPFGSGPLPGGPGQQPLGQGPPPFRFGRQAAGPALKILQNLVKNADPDPAVQQAALTALAGTRLGSTWLLDIHEKKELPDNLQPAVARLLRNSPYVDLRNRAMIAFPPASRLDPKRLPDIAILAKRRGDPIHGHQLMVASVKSELQCLKCHTIQGTGGSVGPDLSAIGTKASRENLFESILFPSKAVADQYLTWVVETKQGLVVTGLLVEETADQITLRDANAKDTKISKTDIETRAKSPESLMPSNLLAYMTEEDLVDMVEYLLQLKSEKK